MATDKYRGRVHLLLLYPDNENHIKVLEKIKQSYDYAAVLHDRDIFEDGTKKKAHYHILIRTPNAVWNTALAKELELEDKFIERVKNTDNALQYLIHYNEPNKTQYSTDDVFGTMKTKLTESINKSEKSEGEKVVDLIAYIDTYDGRLSIRTFAGHCATYGYWSEFRRSASIFIKIIEEHNSKYDLPDQKDLGAYERAKEQARFEGYIQGHQDLRNCEK